MINSTYFSYDGVFSGTYGLQIAEFDPDNVEENEAFSPSLALLKVPSMLRFYHGGINYDSAPTCEFKIISQSAIPPEMRAKILSWLVGRNQFKPLVFHNPDWEDYTYYCVFTGSRTIYINGLCQGFAMTASFDSQFARGPVLEPPYGAQVGISTHGSSYTTGNLVVDNKSTTGDAYVYPKIIFTAGSTSDKGFTITNTTEDSSRIFVFDKNDITAGEVVTIDCELKIVKSSSNKNRYGNITSKNWVRLLPGKNILSVAHGGTLRIESRNYQMIGY